MSSSHAAEDNSSDDLMSKYQRLAAKYSKMRAQITVLKSAYTEEQTKCLDMKDNVVQKDQSVRRLEQEMESLDFRNQQLAKRVAVLQDELSQQQLNHKKAQKGGKQHHSSHSTPAHYTINGDIDGRHGNDVLDVINGELQSKITENERLHIRLNTIEADYQQKMADLQEQLRKTEEQNDEYNNQMTRSLATRSQEMDSLRKDKDSLEEKLKQCLKELDDTKTRSQTFENENKLIVQRLESLEEIGSSHQELRENLQRQLSICESKLSASEQSVEHWMLESQLLQLKLDRELKNRGQTAAAAATATQDVDTVQVPSVSTSDSNAQLSQTTGTAAATIQTAKTSSSTPSTGSQRSIEMSCNDFAGSSLQSPTVSEDKLSLNSNATADEDVPQVTAYLRNRISQLIDGLHAADSKAVAYHTECQSLQQKLSACNRQRLLTAQDMDTKADEMTHLREELATNVSNYEQQLSLMSEHLANMNDKLSAQTDEIASLKQFHSNNTNNSSVKGKKPVKNK